MHSLHAVNEHYVQELQVQVMTLTQNVVSPLTPEEVAARALFQNPGPESSHTANPVATSERSLQTLHLELRDLHMAQGCSQLSPQLQPH